MIDNELRVLHELWDEDGRFYKESDGDRSKRFLLDGKQYEAKIVSIDQDIDTDVFPTKRRVVVQIAHNLNDVHDIVVPVLPGWGETSAQFEGDFLMGLLRALRQYGYQNPKIVGINCSGRGTKEYMQSPNNEKISKIGLQDELDDAYTLALYLDEQGFLGDNITIVGHSMGVLNTMSFLEALIAENSCLGMKSDINQRVKKVVHLMPATDEPLAFLHWRFLLTVRNSVLPAVFQYFRRRGYLTLNEADYHRIMFGNMPELDIAHFKRSVPDSARRFLQLTFNGKRRFKNIFEGDYLGQVGFHVVLGQQDKLIPERVVSNWRKYLGNRIEGIMKGHGMGAFSHSLPFEMNFHQKQQMDQLWNEVLS